MDPQIGTNMLRQYYGYLENDHPHLLVDLYRPGSIIVRMNNGVTVERAENMQDIAALIMTWDFNDIEYRCVSNQLWNLGILVVVIGSLRSAGFIGSRKFAQVLIIVPYADNAYFISYDFFSFVGEENDQPSTSSSSSDDSDPNLLSSVAESDITSQPGRMESDDLLESVSQNIADPSDESTASVEIGTLTSFPNSLDDIGSQPALTEFEKSLDIKYVTLDRVQDQQQSNSEYVNGVLPDIVETDLESLIALAYEMRIQPQIDGADELLYRNNITVDSSALPSEENRVDTDLDSVSCVHDEIASS